LIKPKVINDDDVDWKNINYDGVVPDLYNDKLNRRGDRYGH
jgi:hypothetical protein